MASLGNADTFTQYRLSARLCASCTLIRYRLVAFGGT
jgi:hypothetical protein